MINSKEMEIRLTDRKKMFNYLGETTQDNSLKKEEVNDMIAKMG